MSSTSIDFIPEKAFEFNEESQQQLEINLKYNKFLSNSAFSKNSLSRLRITTKIIFAEDVSIIQEGNFPYLDRDIFILIFIAKIIE